MEDKTDPVASHLVCDESNIGDELQRHKQKDAAKPDARLPEKPSVLVANPAGGGAAGLCQTIPWACRRRGASLRLVCSRHVGAVTAFTVRLADRTRNQRNEACSNAPEPRERFEQAVSFRWRPKVGGKLRTTSERGCRQLREDAKPLRANVWAQPRPTATRTPRAFSHAKMRSLFAQTSARKVLGGC